jgi:hypothetical protein
VERKVSGLIWGIITRKAFIWSDWTNSRTSITKVSILPEVRTGQQYKITSTPAQSVTCRYINKTQNAYRWVIVVQAHFCCQESSKSDGADTYFDLPTALRSFHKLHRESSNSVEFYVTWKFIALLRNSRHTNPLHTLPAQVRHIFILASPLLSDFQNGFFPSNFLTKEPNMYFNHTRHTWLIHLFLLDFF